MTDAQTARREEIKVLIGAALDYLRFPHSEGAVWRLVDAAGLLSEEFPDTTGVACPTGRRYQIIRRIEETP